VHPRSPHLGLVDLRCSRDGSSTEEILEEYPQLMDDILASVAYASEMTRERTVHTA